jgi:hypothetical protein
MIVLGLFLIMGCGAKCSVTKIIGNISNLKQLTILYWNLSTHKRMFVRSFVRLFVCLFVCVCLWVCVWMGGLVGVSGVSGICVINKLNVKTITLLDIVVKKCVCMCEWVWVCGCVGVISLSKHAYLCVCVCVCVCVCFSVFCVYKSPKSATKFSTKNYSTLY